jgi:hypothetical protein
MDAGRSADQRGVAADGGDYRPGDPVWVLRAGNWRPGVVLFASPRAATVRSRPTDAAGFGVDTALAGDLAHRDTVDELLDQAPQ